MQKRHLGANDVQLPAMPPPTSNVPKACCAVCKRRVVLPFPIHPTQVVICTICEGNGRFRHVRNRPQAIPSISSSSSPSTVPRQQTRQPLGPPQLGGQPHAKHKLKKRRLETVLVTPDHPQRHSPSTASQPPPAYSRISSFSGAAPTVGPALGQASELQPTFAPTAPSTVSALAASGPDVSPTMSMDTTLLVNDADVQELLDRWSKTEKLIATLERMKHFNWRGEYLLPCLPAPAERKTVDPRTASRDMQDVDRKAIMHRSLTTSTLNTSLHSKTPPRTPTPSVAQTLSQVSPTLSEASHRQPVRSPLAADSEVPALKRKRSADVISTPRLSGSQYTSASRPYGQHNSSSSSSSTLTAQSSFEAFCPRASASRTEPPAPRTEPSMAHTDHSTSRPHSSSKPLPLHLPHSSPARKSLPSPRADASKPPSPPTPASKGQLDASPVRSTYAARPSLKHSLPAVRVNNDPWDSDLSELTPLESSDSSSSEIDSEDEGETKRVLESNEGDVFVCTNKGCQNLLVPWRIRTTCLTCFSAQPTPKKERAGRMCMTPLCETKLEAGYRWKLCAGCRTHARMETRKRGEEVEKGSKRRKVNMSVKFKPVKVAAMLVPDNVKRYIIYSTQALLLSSLHGRLLGFMTVTSQYLFLQPSALTAPTVFTFEGEYSVVSEPDGGDISSHLQSVEQDIGKQLSVELLLRGYQAEENGAVTAQWRCMHELLVPVPSPKSTPADSRSNPMDSVHVKSEIASLNLADRSALDAVKTATVEDEPAFDVLVKRMVGELSVSVLWDRSHRLFPGLRTVVVFKLVG